MDDEKAKELEGYVSVNTECRILTIQLIAIIFVVIMFFAAVGGIVSWDLNKKKQSKNSVQPDESSDEDQELHIFYDAFVSTGGNGHKLTFEEWKVIRTSDLYDFHSHRHVYYSKYKTNRHGVIIERFNTSEESRRYVYSAWKKMSVYYEMKMITFKEWMNLKKGGVCIWHREFESYTKWEMEDKE